jgi:hypothetical protein
MATLKFTYFFNYKNDAFKSNGGTYLIGDEFISYTHDLQDTYSIIQKPHVLTKRAEVNALLRMLTVCIHVYLNSVPRHKFLIFDACHPDTLYFREQGREDPFFTFAGPCIVNVFKQDQQDANTRCCV